MTFSRSVMALSLVVMACSSGELETTTTAAALAAQTDETLSADVPYRLDPPPQNDRIYGYSHGCYTVEALDGTAPPQTLVSVGDRFEFTEATPAPGARFRMRASDLGTDLFYNADARFLSAQTDADGWVFTRPASLESSLQRMDGAFKSSGEWEHIAHATPRLHRWLDLRGRFGFSEWHSNVYSNKDIPALLNLVDFAEDAGLRSKAALVLDILVLDLAHNTYKGLLATTHGRSYPNKFQNGLTDSTRDAAWLMRGLGTTGDTVNCAGSFTATRDYAPPLVLESLAEAIAERHEMRQRDGLNVEMGPEAGVGYEGLDDTVVWAGMAALLDPMGVKGATAVMTEYDLWTGCLFGDLPDDILGLFQGLTGTDRIVAVSEGLRRLSKGFEGHWFFGRKGDAWLALWSQALGEWSTDDPNERRVNGEQNVWVVQLGTIEEQLSLDAFVAAVSTATIAVDEKVSDAAPWLGAVVVGWTGPMRVAGAEFHSARICAGVARGIPPSTVRGTPRFPGLVRPWSRTSRKGLGRS
jgi:hypothetical protein